MVCCATVNVVSSAPTSRTTYNSPQPLHLTAQSRSSSIVSPPKSTLFCRTFFPSFPLSHLPVQSSPLIRLRSSSGFQAPSSPGLVSLSVTASQRDVSCSAEALIQLRKTRAQKRPPAAERNLCQPTWKTEAHHRCGSAAPNPGCETATAAAAAQSTVEPSSSSGEDGVGAVERSNKPRLAWPRPAWHSSSPLPRNSTTARPRPASHRTQPFLACSRGTRRRISQCWRFRCQQCFTAERIRRAAVRCVSALKEQA